MYLFQLISSINILKKVQHTPLNSAYGLVVQRHQYFIKAVLYYALYHVQATTPIVHTRGGPSETSYLHKAYTTRGHVNIMIIRRTSYSYNIYRPFTDLSFFSKTLIDEGSSGLRMLFFSRHVKRSIGVKIFSGCVPCS